MRAICSLITTLILLLGCSEGVPTAETYPTTSDTISPDVLHAKTVPPPSRFADHPTSHLVDYYLHYYDRPEEEQDYELHDAVKEELIARGAETVSDLLKYDYSLNKYPYSDLSSELIKAIGPNASQAIPVLAKSLAQGTDPTFGNRYEVANLVAIGPASIPELIRYFNGEDLHIAWAVSVPLEQLGRMWCLT
ncbi:MAG: hypothetical protein ACPGYV_09375 [Phycisphaeraceae bacterium]